MRFAASLLERVRATRPADRAGIAVIAAVVLVAAGFVLAGRLHPAGTDSSAEVERFGDRLDAARPWEPHAEAADGGTVEVLEQGFARLPKAGGDDDRYAVGFVLENTSRTDAVIPDIDVTVLDEDGDEVTDVEATGGLENETIPPGARIGVADTLYFGEPVAARVSVGIGRSEWYPARPDIGEIETARVEPDGREGLDVDIDSAYDTTVFAPVFYALFRDEAGRLLGGQSIRPLDSDDPVPPGRSRHELGFDHPPPEDADMDASELHVISDRTVITF